MIYRLVIEKKFFLNVGHPSQLRGATALCIPITNWGRSYYQMNFQVIEDNLLSHFWTIADMKELGLATSLSGIQEATKHATWSNLNATSSRAIVGCGLGCGVTLRVFRRLEHCHVHDILTTSYEQVLLFQGSRRRILGYELVFLAGWGNNIMMERQTRSIILEALLH